MIKADIILKSQTIFDAVNEEPYRGFVAVKGNRITAVGKTEEELSNWIDINTRIINCGDKLVMPGMIDAHMHFFDGIFQNSQYMCRDLFECKSARECVEVIGRFAKEHPDYKTIAGMGWFIPLWEDKEPPNKRMLDEIEPKRPVYLMCADGHSFWLNSAALEECQVDPERELLFGSIELDEKGEPNGLLHELDACAPCTIKAHALPEKQKRQLIADYINQLLKHGITSVTDITVLPEPGPITKELEILEDFEKNGELNIRVSLYFGLGATDNYSVVKNYRDRFHSDKFNVAGLKAFVDGVHGNHTALLLEPYEDKPESMGASFFPYEFYAERVTSANKNGFGVKLHCTGAGATKLALDAFEESYKVNGSGNIRNSIEHVETLRYEDIERLRELDVTATMQPMHLMFVKDGLVVKLGQDRTKYQYAIKTMLSKGVNVAFSTDYPVAPFEPAINIYFAITRCDMEGNPVEMNSTEKITLSEALKAYTFGSAYCLKKEDKLGTLEAGKLADIIVFDRNLFNIKPVEILDSRIGLTMVDGVIVYKNNI